MFLSIEEPVITENSSIFDRMGLGASTLLIGMLVVFAMLGIIFIALQIMRAVFKRNAIKAKKARNAEAAEAPVPVPAPAPASDDSAVVAAIIAAISAHTGKAPDTFRVVSFKKRR